MSATTSLSSRHDRGGGRGACARGLARRLGRNGWRGAAWGAGAGWLLGSIIDANAGYGYDGYGYPRRVAISGSEGTVALDGTRSATDALSTAGLSETLA